MIKFTAKEAIENVTKRKQSQQSVVEKIPVIVNWDQLNFDLARVSAGGETSFDLHIWPLTTNKEHINLEPEQRAMYIQKTYKHIKPIIENAGYTVALPPTGISQNMFTYKISWANG